MNFVQAASISGTGSATVALPYGSPNSVGNLGIAWCFCENGLPPSSLTDTQGNGWCLINGNVQSGQSMAVFVCFSLKAGVNTVTAAFSCIPSDGTPSFHLEEYSYTAGAEFYALQPQSIGAVDPYVQGSQGVLPSSPVSATYIPISSGAIQSKTVTLFLGVYDFASNHGWGNGGYGIPRASTTEGGSGYAASTASGENTVASGGSQTVFKVGFDAIFALPPIVPATTNVVAFMVVEP